jgi:hypothetical protein
VPAEKEAEDKPSSKPFRRVNDVERRLTGAFSPASSAAAHIPRINRSMKESRYA